MIRALAYSCARELDKLMSRDVNAAITILEAGEYASARALKDDRDRSFSSLVRHAYDNVPYWRRVMDERGVTPQSAKSFESLGRFPVLTKDNVREAGSSIRASNIPDSACMVNRSGGTTGEPIAVRLDRRARALGTYASLRGWKWMGWIPGMRFVRLFAGSLGRPNRDTLRARLRDYAVGTHLLPAFGLTQQNARDYLDTIEQLAPCIVTGYASAIYNLSIHADVLGRRGLGIACVFSTAEFMPDDWSQKISRIFECPVKCYYGCGEVNSLGFQVAERGPYVIPDEHVIIESVGPEAGSCIRTQNTLLITALYLYAQPLIRYMVGDSGEVALPGAYHPTRSCITRLLGRTQDMFFRPDGTRVSSMLGAMLIQVTRAPVRRYQLIQKGIHDIEFRYEPEHADLTAVQRDELTRILRDHLDAGVKVNFVRTTDFILSAGEKHRIMIVDPILQQCFE